MSSPKTKVCIKRMKVRPGLKHLIKGRKNKATAIALVTASEPADRTTHPSSTVGEERVALLVFAYTHSPGVRRCWLHTSWPSSRRPDYDRVLPATRRNRVCDVQVRAAVQIK